MKENVKDVIPQAHKHNILTDILHLLRGVRHLPQWHAQRLCKRDMRLWTFGAWSGLRYSDNSRVLYEYVLAHHPEIRAVWMTRNEQVYNRLRQEGKPVAMCTTKEGKKLQRLSGVFFSTANTFDSDVMQMNGIQFINLWHGMPIKKVGDDAMARLRNKGLWKRLKTNLRKHLMPWEFVSGPTLCSSPFFRPFYLSAFALPEEGLWPIVEPRLSRLDGRSSGERLIQQLDTQFNKPLKVLYMPTFRDDKIGKFNPFKMAEGFDKEHFEQMLEDNNIVFMYKGHFLDDVKADIGNNGRLRTIGDDDYDDLYRFLNDIDILVSDYSSIYFDFLLLKRPIILFPFDEAEYVSKAREFYYDYSLLEAKRVYSWNEMEQCLCQRTYYPPTKQEIQRFRPLPIGNCCEELVQKILSL